MGRTTTTLSSGGGGVSFFREALLKNSSLLFVFIKCSQSVKGVLLVCCFVKKKRPTKDFASFALLVVVFWSPFSISLLVVADCTHDPPDETLAWSSRPQESTTTSLAQRKSLYVFRR